VVNSRFTLELFTRNGKIRSVDEQGSLQDDVIFEDFLSDLVVGGIFVSHDILPAHGLENFPREGRASLRLVSELIFIDSENVVASVSHFGFIKMLDLKLAQTEFVDQEVDLVIFEQVFEHFHSLPVRDVISVLTDQKIASAGLTGGIPVGPSQQLTFVLDNL
jgi:hypothetical protein